MYSARLKRKPEYSHLQGTIEKIHKYSDMQTKQLEGIKKQIEARNTRANSILVRKQLMAHQNKLNYNSELDRIRGYLSENSSRFPMGTKQRLDLRAAELKRLGAQVIDINS